MHLRLPLEPASARRGRTFVRAVVAGWEPGADADRLDVLELLASELITNSLVHARSELEITADRDQRGVRVAVSDLDSRRPVVLPYDEHALGGRGLALVDVLADEWGVDQLPEGKAVWFRLQVANPNTVHLRVAASRTHRARHPPAQLSPATRKGPPGAVSARLGDHLGCQSWDHRRVVPLVGRGLPLPITSCRVTPRLSRRPHRHLGQV